MSTDVEPDLRDRFATIRVELAGAVATVTLNRPERMNAITRQMVREVGLALSDLASDNAVRVVVLTGSGIGFCPGADLARSNENQDGSASAPLTPDDLASSMLLHTMPAVTVAAINGACAGAGLAWAALCDLRVATSSARFNTAFLDVGAAGDMLGAWTLPRLLGAAKARELYLLPGKFDAHEALRIGLVSRVFEEASFEPEVAALVARLAAAAPLALRDVKANFLAAERLDIEAYSRVESERHLALLESADSREGFAARAENRAPRFQGR